MPNIQASDARALSRGYVLLIGALLPFGGAALLCIFASLWPVRLDYRSLQEQNWLRAAGLRQSHGKFVLFTHDDGVASVRLATFGLRQIAFPDGTVDWVIPKENASNAPNTGLTAVASDGTWYRLVAVPGAAEWQVDESSGARALQFLGDRTIVIDSPETQKIMEERFPPLRNYRASTVLLANVAPPPTLALQGARNEFSAVRMMRIASVLGCFVSVFLLLFLAPRTPIDLWSSLGAAVFVSIGLVMCTSYLLQFIVPVIVPWTPFGIWCGGLLVAIACLSPTSITRGTALPEPRQAMRKSWIKLVLFALGVYLLLFLVRLDFDGDFFDNWLPQGRFHYYLGSHQPEQIITQGSSQAAAYPPGYGIALSVLMWMCDLPRSESFTIGPGTSFAILLYRLFVCGLNCALFLLLLTHLGRIEPANVYHRISAVFATLVLIPSTAGQHIGAETLLFPMLAAAILLIARGHRSQNPTLVLLGLAVGGMATLIKVEATLLLGLAVIPWLVRDSFTLRFPALPKLTLAGLAVLLGSAFATMVWRSTLAVHYEMFAPVSLRQFKSSLHAAPEILTAAMKVIFEQGRFVLAFIALPCAAAVQARQSRALASLIVPTCILTLFLGWIGIYFFSNSNPAVHLAVSYPRLIMVPTFGAVLYCWETLADLAQTSGSPARQ